jgi:hypothetical protein
MRAKTRKRTGRDSDCDKDKDEDGDKYRTETTLSDLQGNSLIWASPGFLLLQLFSKTAGQQVSQQEQPLSAFTYGHLLAFLPAQARPSCGISSTFSRQVHCFQRKLSCRSYRCICTASCGGEMLNTCDTCGLHVSGGVLEALLGFPPSDPQYLL